MAIEEKNQNFKFVAKTALDNNAAGTGVIYKAVDDGTGDIAATGVTATGILQSCARSGGHVTEAYQGFSKYTAGAAITSLNQWLTVTTSGYFIASTSGTWVVGKNKIGTVTSGSVGTGEFNFTIPQLDIV